MEEPFVTKERYLKAVTPCMELSVSRNERYGNSIDIVRDSSILDLVLMKLIRTRELPDTDPKYTDEVKDSINYLVYILMRRDKNA